MRDTGLANRLRKRGLKVVEIAGWQTRGNDDFFPKGAVNHHTAGSPKGNAPSLAICTYGRADLPGPLCHVLLGRDLVCYVIAAGRANHAGTGGWLGLSGNRTVHGLEIEHVGYGPSPDQILVAIQIHAAFLEAPGSTRDAKFVCQHFEWAPNRKVDFRDLAPWTAQSFRNDVAKALKTTPIPPTQLIAAQEDDEMDLLIKDPTGAYWLKSGATRTHMSSYAMADAAVWDRVVTENQLNEARKSWGLGPVQLVAHAGVAKKEDGKDHFEPFTWSQAAVDQLVIVK